MSVIARQRSSALVMGSLGATLALTGGLLLGGAAPSGPDGADPAPDARLTVEPVDSPAPPGSGQPQLAVDPRGRFLLSWVERGDGPASRFRLARLDTAGWSPARTIAEGDDFFVNWADVPSIFALSDGRLAAHWLAKNGEGTFAYDVRLRTSADEGATWSPPVTPHRDGTQTEHGFASFFETPDGALGLAWLDGRHMTAGGHGGHGHGAGAMTLRATVLDRDGNPGPDWVLDDRVCECCPTSAVRTPRGIVVAYRDRGETEIRDIFVSRFEHGAWTKGVAVHEDNWEMPACPVNGPALAARDDVVALAWFTAVGTDPEVRIAFSQDAGRAWTAPTRVDGGVPLGRLSNVLLADGSALVGWIEFNDGTSEFRVRRVWPDGRLGDETVVTPISSDRASGYPRLARSGDRILAAWTETSPERRVRVARLTFVTPEVPQVAPGLP